MAGVTLCHKVGYTVTTLPVLLIAMLLLESVNSCNVAGSSCRNGTCYFVNTEGMMWHNALDHCNNICNGRLAVIRDRDTQIFLHKLTSSKVWLGGKEVNLTDWMWIDQEGALTATTYTHWSGPRVFPYIGQQPDTNNGLKFQPAVALMRLRNTTERFPWLDREYLQTQESGVICEADQKSQVCQGKHSFHWVQNNSRWTDIKDEACIFISVQPERVTWFEGHRLCREAGGKLLKIDNDTVQKNVENRLNNNSGPRYYWIGLVHSEWRWVNDGPINLMFWRPIMYPPYQAGPACLALEGAASDVTRSWLMKDCSETLPYICEYPLDATMPNGPSTTIVVVNPPVTDGLLVITTIKSDEVNMTASVSGTVPVGWGAGLIVVVTLSGIPIVTILAFAGVVIWRRKPLEHITKASDDYTARLNGIYDDIVAVECGMNYERLRRQSDPFYQELVHNTASPDTQDEQASSQAESVDGTYDNPMLEGINGNDAVYTNFPNIAGRNGDVIGNTTEAS
ncbi:macrophage mannose receptor 1-like [Lingula anatina]|uniref:Macrophage mannose receptor 1-like n=1 Tax=Lingula anatina TaxID=7574 RepID=A0A1S3KBU0_LINAN|nr:macrophage mannose receptor 1-like [Lingula anatina]|eukprot:XP_013419962.1 macrophage mannose receptor 1-like [Lingula anatina]